MRIESIGPGPLERYGRLPSLVRVTSVLAPEALEGGLGGIVLRERPVAEPWTKDYDAAGGPLTWLGRLDLDGARIALAVEDGPDGGAVLGGAVTLAGYPGDERAAAVLWDIRVREDARGRGIGRGLLEDARGWARQQGFRWMVAETQHVNVPACRFYAASGATLIAIDRLAYAGDPSLAHEVRLDWGFMLGGASG